MTVLPAGLEHDTVMDQKTPYDSAVLHLLPQVASHLTLECVNLRGVVLPVTAMQRFPSGVSRKQAAMIASGTCPTYAQNAARM